jgi:hypothetical protein
MIRSSAFKGLLLLLATVAIGSTGCVQSQAPQPAIAAADDLQASTAAKSPPSFSKAQPSVLTPVTPLEFDVIRKYMERKNSPELFLEVPNVIIVAPYALASWTLYPTGSQGEALFKQNSNRWEVVEHDQGAIDIIVLAKLGIPTQTREELHNRKIQAYELQILQREASSDGARIPDPVDYLSGKFYSKGQELPTTK